MEVKKKDKTVLQWCQGVVGASGFLDSGARSSRTPPKWPEMAKFLCCGQGSGAPERPGRCNQIWQALIN